MLEDVATTRKRPIVAAQVTVNKGGPAMLEACVFREGDIDPERDVAHNCRCVDTPQVAQTHVGSDCRCTCGDSLFASNGGCCRDCPACGDPTARSEPCFAHNGRIYYRRPQRIGTFNYAIADHCRAAHIDTNCGGYGLTTAQRDTTGSGRRIALSCGTTYQAGL